MIFKITRVMASNPIKIWRNIKHYFFKLELYAWVSWNTKLDAISYFNSKYIFMVYEALKIGAVCGWMYSYVRVYSIFIEVERVAGS